MEATRRWRGTREWRGTRRWRQTRSWKRNQLLWLGGLSRVKAWLVSVAVVAFTGASKGQSCPHPGVCHCLGDSCYCCTLKCPVGHFGGPSSPFSPSTLPGGPGVLQGRGWDTRGTEGGRLKELRVNQGPNLLMLSPSEIPALPPTALSPVCSVGTGQTPKIFVLNGCSPLSPTPGCCNWGWG